MVTTLIKAKNLTKVYGDSIETEYKALDGVSFEVQEKEIIGISGSSGSGKTTLLGIIGCLTTANSGSLEIFGRNVEKLTDFELSEIRLKHIGFIFQEHNLVPALTVAENLMLPLTLNKIDRSTIKSRVNDLLNIVGLEELRDRFPSQLSRGQRQRIAAVRALANNPRIILADEPTSDLDRENASILLSFLEDLNKRIGTTIIIGATDSDAFQGITHRNLKLIDGKMQ